MTKFIFSVDCNVKIIISLTKFRAIVVNEMMELYKSNPGWSGKGEGKRLIGIVNVLLYHGYIYSGG